MLTTPADETVAPEPQFFATVQALHSRLDPETLDELDNPVELVLNDIGAVTLRTSSVVIADPSDNAGGGAQFGTAN